MHERICLARQGDRDSRRLSWVRRLPYRVMIAWPGVWLGTWFGLSLGAGMLGQPAQGFAKELHFVIRDVEGEQAVWFPREVFIHRHSDLTEPLSFRLENPTPRTHVFEAPGLFESIEEGGVPTIKPLRVTIASEETMLVVVDRDRLVDDVIASEGGTMTYRFYCPLHRDDTATGSRILVVP